MIGIVLAAGYATRLYPLTSNFPKPLLDVGGKAIIDWILEDIDSCGQVDSYVVISNHKYLGYFDNWRKQCKLLRPVTIIDDGSTNNENRLGAVKDIAFAIDHLKLNDDLVVLAGDNLLDFSISAFLDYFYKKQSTCIMRHHESDIEKLRKTGVALVDNSDKVLGMEEKPIDPKSSWAVPPFYIYEKAVIPMIAKGIQNGVPTDAPGSLITWLCTKCTVYAMEMPGNRYDIGDIQSYQSIKQHYKGISKMHLALKV